MCVLCTHAGGVGGWGGGEAVLARWQGCGGKKYIDK